MKVLGTVLVVLGILGLIYGGVAWTRRDTVVDAGPVPSPPILLGRFEPPSGLRFSHGGTVLGERDRYPGGAGGGGSRLPTPDRCLRQRDQ